MQKTTILVTGAMGHIGSRLIRSFSEALVKKVVLLDNFQTQRYASVFNLPENFQYQLIEEDVCTADLDKYVRDMDAVIHLAALTDAESSHRHPEEVEKVNLQGLQRVADACLRNRVKLMFPSTTSVYGSQAARVDETCQELKPQSPYAESKLAAENYLKKLGAQGLRFVIFRFGTIFGPSIGMRFHTAVNKFIWQAVVGKPLTVWKTAWQQKRPYLDLGDCVKAVHLSLEKEIFDRQIYNVLTDNFTVEGIVKQIKEFIPSLQVGYVDSPIMNQLSYEVDDAKFRALGYRPGGDLAKGILDTIQQLKGVRAV